MTSTPVWDPDRACTATVAEDGRVLGADARLADLLGGRPSKLQDACASADDRDAFASAIRRAPARVTVGMRTREGERAIEWALSAIAGASGERTVVAQGLARDELDALRTATRTAEERAERLDTLLEAVPDPVFFKDGEGRWLEVNEPALELFGLSGVDYRGRTDAELSTTCEASRPLMGCVDTDEKAWAEGKVSSAEEIVPARDGTRRHFDTYKVPLFHADGRRRALVVLGRDVTHRRRAELALERRERRYRKILEATLDAVLLADPDGTLTFANPAAARMLGVPANDIVGRRWNEGPWRFERPNGEPVDTDVDWTEATKRSGGSELVVVGPDATRTVVSYSATALEGETIVVTAQDVTERAEVGALKNAFLRVAAHELRTPLTPLRLLLHHARDRAARHEPLDANAIVRMLRQVDRLAHLVDDLVDFVRLDAGVMPIRREPFDLAALVATVVREFRDAAPGRVLRLALPPGPVVVRGDAIALELALENLVDNALKYSDGDVEIDVAEGPRSVRVAVTDHGAGIASDQRTKIFSPFYRATGEATTRTGGLGLGLALSREAVRRHGGELDYTTRVGAGSTFFLELPRERVDVEARSSHAESHP